MKVNISSSENPCDIEVKDISTGEALSGIVGIIYEARVEPGFPKVTLELQTNGSTLQGVASARFTMRHPITGEPKRIKAIQFFDGEIWKAGQ